MSDILDCVEIEPNSPESPAIASIIWLHGLGANGHDFETIVPELRLPQEIPIRFVFPHSPSRPITINNGHVMPGWFDILDLESRDNADKTGILESVHQLEQLIQRENERGIPSNKIILAGFSQGGVIALHTALQYKEPLAGIMVLSSYLPLVEYLEEQLNESNKNTPVFWAHGQYDPVLKIGLGQSAYKQLQHWGYKTEWHEYPMEHQVCTEEIQHISQWLQSLFINKS